jgi:hypothetical protein
MQETPYSIHCGTEWTVDAENTLVTFKRQILTQDFDASTLVPYSSDWIFNMVVS